MANEEITGGLSVAEQPTAEENALQGAAQNLTGGNVTIGGGKGALNVGKTPLSAEQTDALLRRMEEMLAQKTGGWHDFMSGMQDAAAWAVPGIGGQKALALQSRNQQKQQEMQDVFNIQTQMAGLKSKSDMIAAMREADKKTGWGGTPGANVVGGVQDLSPQDIAHYNMLLTTDPDAAIKFKTARLQDIGKARAGQQYGTNMNDIVEVPFRKPDGSLGMKQVLRSQAVRELGSPQEAMTLPKVAGGAPQMQPMGNAASLAQGLGVPIASGDRSIEKQTELYKASLQPGYVGPPVAKPGSSQHNFGNAIDVDSSKFTPEHAQTLRENGFVQPLPKKDPNHWELAGARQPQAAPYQVASTVPVAPPKTQVAGSGVSQQLTPPAAPQGGLPTTAPAAAAPQGGLPTALPSTSALSGVRPAGQMPVTSGPIDIAEAKAAGKMAEETQLATLEGLREQSRGSGKATNELLRFADEESRLRPLLQVVGKHARDFPDEFAVASKPGTAMGAAAWAGRYYGGPEGREFVEENLPDVAIRPGAKGRRDETAAAATQIGIKAISDMFSGNGSVRVGAQISNLVQSGKGLGINISAQANEKFAKVAELGLDRAVALANALKQYRISSGNKAAQIDDLPQQTMWKIDDWVEKQAEERGIISKLSPQEAAKNELNKRKTRNITIIGNAQ